MNGTEQQVPDTRHCPTCTCKAEVTSVEHSCKWCDINPYHPKCPANAESMTDELCPHCGCDPEDYTMHADGCITLGTCAATRPGLPKPWHPDSEWLHGERFTIDRMYQHYAEQHGKGP